MQNLFECGLTGKVIRDTDPVRGLMVDLDDQTRVQVRVLKRQSKDSFVEVPIGPDAVAQIEVAARRIMETTLPKKGGK